jgi:hypothetical protein
MGGIVYALAMLCRIVAQCMERASKEEQGDSSRTARCSMIDSRSSVEPSWSF